jgi:hypothetical protein
MALNCFLQQASGYAPNQYPGYLLPDGSWRYGPNAKKIAAAAWAPRQRSGSLKEHCEARREDADRDDVTQ